MEARTLHIKDVDNKPSSKEMDKLALVKFEILASGLRLTATAISQLDTNKRPIRTRSGVSGGLDLVLPFNVHVNAPIKESFSRHSPLFLDFSCSEGFFIRRGQDLLFKAQLQPEPAYYRRKTHNGRLMRTIGQMCSGDRFCYGMTGPYCRFWKKVDRCQFCSIGFNKADDASRKKLEELLSTLEYAVNDPHIPAKHVLLGGGTPNTEDMGASLAALYCREIKKRFDLSVYVMIAAPLDNDSIDELYEAGANELGMNLEFWSDEAWQEYIPGKNRIIGKKRYLEALEYAVSKFGPINTRSIFVAGIESPKHTVEGAIYVASRGIMPIISPFRPLDQTMLQDQRGFDHMTYYSMYQTLRSELLKFDMPLGPTCNACQNNVLALPFGPHYRYY